MRIQDYQDLREGDIIVIAAFDGWPEHLFEVDEVFVDSVSGYSIPGPLTGAYGEPSYDLIIRAYRREPE